MTPPMPSKPFIPQSESCLLLSGGRNSNPQTPPQATGNGFHLTPDAATSGNRTEPRNYAPRTSGQPAVHEPPPKFNLGVVAHGSQNTAQQLADPFDSTPVLSMPMVVSQPLEAQGPLPVLRPCPEVQAQRSYRLNTLTNTPSGLPTFAAAMDNINFPFAEGGKCGTANNNGVVRIKNIPFSAKRAEVIAFLGRNSKILNDADEPVHIIMERVTSKTMDAFVEFTTMEDAMRAVEKHQHNLQNGRLSRLGDRPVEVELSSQSSLMKELFPLAVGLMWNGVTPVFAAHNAKHPWENFKGFISEEEMTMLVKHVEVPHRSPFSKECPQRPYECLISTIKKFPWAMTDRIRIRQRRAVYRAACDLICLLSRSMYKQDDPINLNMQLFKRVVAAAMNCPGFTPVMKDDIAHLVRMSEADMQIFGQPRFATSWRHQYALAPKPGMPLDVVEWYIAIVREQTIRDTIHRSMHERNEIQERSRDTDLYWGHFWVEVGYTMGPQFDDMTLAQAAKIEFAALERILARALPRD